MTKAELRRLVDELREFQSEQDYIEVKAAIGGHRRSTAASLP